MKRAWGIGEMHTMFDGETWGKETTWKTQTCMGG